ncbi:hypothetical protein [Spirillospora sp. NPDC029432]|uniref:hypothetical protein n=1 Tax=Spirillospora sp. NPDC029432 TaxID=3154599 RepID=UPI003452B505
MIFPAPVRVAAAGAALLALNACGTGASGGARPCTMIAARHGIGLDIRPPDAAKVETATMRICWNGACRNERLTLRGTSRPVPMGCDGEGPDAACGASSSPDGGKHGFAEVGDLPRAPVQVTVVLRGAGGKRLVDEKIDVTPRVTYPNGRHCGAGSPQAGLVVSAGKVAVRP